MFAKGKAAGVAISFDDAFVDEWYSLKDLFNKYEAKVTFYVSHFDLLPEESLEKLKILQENGHEIAFHGLRHIGAAKFVKENSLNRYLETEIFPGIDAMTKCGFSPSNFSYPYGARDPYLDKALLRYFKHVRGVVCTNHGKRIVDFNQVYYRGNKGLIFSAGMDNIYGNSVEDIQYGLRKAMDHKKTLLLFAHKPSNDAGDYCVPPTRLEAVLKYASENKLKFYRISDL